MEGLQIYFILLLAVIAGWLLGRYTKRTPSGGSRSRPAREIFADYFVGLNYLLNDEPDEAIDTFIRGLEVNSETVETHLALGALLRRRGKVDKAIKVHQVLLARPGLAQNIIDETRLQLANDYIAAGLLDRAERLLNEILEEKSSAQWEALALLITIYQTEKEWPQAIDAARQLLSNNAHRSDKELRSRGAHFCCEVAEELLAESQINQARDWIKKAFTFDRHSIRATLLLADIERRLGNHRACLRELLRVCQNSSEFTGELLEPLEACYDALGQRKDYERLLRELLAKEHNIQVALALAELIRSTEGDQIAIQFLLRQLESTPNLAGVKAVLGLQIVQVQGEAHANLQRLQVSIDAMLGRKPHYRCENCGYEARSLNWNCPSCKKWDKMKPVLDIN